MIWRCSHVAERPEVRHARVTVCSEATDPESVWQVDVCLFCRHYLRGLLEHGAPRARPQK